MIRGLDHCSFSVSDLERSIQFYERSLGFSLLWQINNDTSTELRTQVGYPDATVSIAQLQLQGSPVKLELIEYVHKATNAPRGKAPERKSVGAAHVCLQVDDIDAEVLRLTELGSPFVSSPQFFDDDGGIKAVYLLDPDGITVELIQSCVEENRS